MMEAEAPPLSRTQRLLLRLFGYVKIGWLRGPGWTAWLQAYAFECKRHGVVVNYGQGYDGRLFCPFCESVEVSGG
jgi:hypothetical protein